MIFGIYLHIHSCVRNNFASMESYAIRRNLAIKLLRIETIFRQFISMQWTVEVQPRHALSSCLQREPN